MNTKAARTERATGQEHVAPDVLEWQIQAIEEGIRDEEQGNLIPHEEVMAMWKTRLEDQMGQGGHKGS